MLRLKWWRNIRGSEEKRKRSFHFWDSWIIKMLKSNITPCWLQSNKIYSKTDFLCYNDIPDMPSSCVVLIHWFGIRDPGIPGTLVTYFPLLENPWKNKTKMPWNNESCPGRLLLLFLLLSIHFQWHVTTIVVSLNPFFCFGFHWHGPENRYQSSQN